MKSHRKGHETFTFARSACYVVDLVLLMCLTSDGGCTVCTDVHASLDGFKRAVCFLRCFRFSGLAVCCCSGLYLWWCCHVLSALWLGWAPVVFLLSAGLCSLSCLVALLTLMLSIRWCPTVEYRVRLVVGSASFPGMGLLGCCSPDVGSMVPLLLRAPV